MKITVEFTGITRAIARADEIEFEVPDGFTYRDLVKLLAEKFPDMVGIIIDPNREDFLSSNMFVVNGDLEFAAMIMDKSPADGERMALMSVITGG